MNDIFQVEEIEAISFDDNGQEDGTWIGWAVTSIDDPSRHCFECRDNVNADQLCDFLNENISRDTSINDDIIDNLTEWSGLVTELSKKEVKLLKLKDIIFDKEQWIIENTDFKAVYGKNNADVRKLHFSKHMKGEYENRRELEVSIDYLKRRISFLKQLVHTKTVLAGVKE